MIEKIMSAVQVSRMLGISKSTFYRWLEDGTLPRQMETDEGKCMGYTESMISDWQQRLKQNSNE